jgi:hypothetical protein
MLGLCQHSKVHIDSKYKLDVAELGRCIGAKAQIHYSTPTIVAIWRKGTTVKIHMRSKPLDVFFATLPNRNSLRVLGAPSPVLTF